MFVYWALTRDASSTLKYTLVSSSHKSLQYDVIDCNNDNMYLNIAQDNNERTHQQLVGADIPSSAVVEVQNGQNSGLRGRKQPLRVLLPGLGVRCEPNQSLVAKSMHEHRYRKMIFERYSNRSSGRIYVAPNISFWNKSYYNLINKECNVTRKY